MGYKKKFGIYAVEKKIWNMGDDAALSWYHAFLALGECDNDQVSLIQELHYFKKRGGTLVDPRVMNAQEGLAHPLNDMFVECAAQGNKGEILMRWAHMLRFAKYIRQQGSVRFLPGIQSDPDVINCRKLAQKTLEVGGVQYAFNKKSDAGLESEYKTQFPRLSRVKASVDLDVLIAGVAKISSDLA